MRRDIFQVIADPTRKTPSLGFKKQHVGEELHTPQENLHQNKILPNIQKSENSL